MKKTVMAALAAATFLGASAVAIANPHSHLAGRLVEMARKDRAAGLEKRVERFKERLKLTGEQQKHWPAFEAAMREQVKMRQSMRADRKAATDGTGSALDRMSRRAERAARMAAMQKSVAEAARPLYESLDTGQKATFDKLLSRGGGKRDNSGRD